MYTFKLTLSISKTTPIAFSPSPVNHVSNLIDGITKIDCTNISESWFMNTLIGWTCFEFNEIYSETYK